MFTSLSRTKSVIAELFIYAGIYTAAWWGLLFQPTGYWWDDWLLRTLTPQENWEIYADQGNIFFGSIVVGLHTLSPVSLSIVTFLCGFITSIFFGRISGRFFRLSAHSVFVITVLTLVLPLVTARLLKVMTPFYVDMFLFTLAWYLLTRFLTRRFWLVSFVSIPLLALSFTTPSLMPMNYVFLGLFYFSTTRESRPNLKSLLPFLKWTWPIWLTPPLFWILNRQFSSPHGIYENYNSISLFLGSRNLVLALALSILMLFLSIGLFYRIWSKSGVEVQKSMNKLIFCSSVAMIITATIPYILVAKPSVYFLGYDSRHQLLFCFGGSLLIFGLLSQINNRSKFLGKIAFIVVSVSCIIATNILVLQFHVDFKKQLQISEFLSTDELSQGNKTFVIKDESLNLNIPRHIDYTFYEIGGWLEAAFEDRGVLGFFGSSDRSSTYSDFEQKSILARYGSTHYQKTVDGVEITITPKFDVNWPWLAFSESPLVDVKSLYIPDVAKYIEKLDR